MAGMLKHLWQDESGGAGIVYGVVGAAVTAGLVFGMQALGVPIDGIVEAVDGLIQSAVRALGLNA